MKQYKFSHQMHLKNKPQVNVRSSLHFLCLFLGQTRFQDEKNEKSLKVIWGLYAGFNVIFKLMNDACANFYLSSQET